MRFGSVGGGGRYDGLVSRFRGEPVPATGFSIGVSRLAAALQHLGKLDSKPEPGPVVVTVFDKDRLADYQSMVAKLRAANIRAELYLGNPANSAISSNTPTSATRLASSSRAPTKRPKAKSPSRISIIGAELAKLEKGREEHLQKQAEAQRSVPRNGTRRRGAQSAGAPRTEDRLRKAPQRIGPVTAGRDGGAGHHMLRTILFALCGVLIAAVSVVGGMLIFGTGEPPPALRSIGKPFESVDFSDLPPLEKMPARNGTPIAFRVWRQARRCPIRKRVVIAIHGSSAMSASLHPLGKALSAQGISVYAPGHSRPRRHRRARRHRLCRRA